MAFKINGAYSTLTIERTATHEIYKFILGHDYAWIAVEQFRTSNIISRYGLRTTELVGAIECLCWLRRVPCIRRNEQDRLPLAHVAREMLQGKEHSDHEVSALAHLLSTERAIEQGRVVPSL